MTDLIILAVVVGIVGTAIVYIVKAKKSGTKCIGCPDAATCGKCSAGGCSCSGCGCSGASGCSCHTDTR